MVVFVYSCSEILKIVTSRTKNGQYYYLFLFLHSLKQLVAQQSAEIAYLRQELEAEKLRSSQLSGILAAMDENNNEAGPSSLHAGPSSPQAGPSSLHARPSPLHASPLSDSNDTGKKKITLTHDII